MYYTLFIFKIMNVICYKAILINLCKSALLLSIKILETNLHTTIKSIYILTHNTDINFDPFQVHIELTRKKAWRWRIMLVNSGAFLKLVHFPFENWWWLLRLFLFVYVKGRCALLKSHRSRIFRLFLSLICLSEAIKTHVKSTNDK